MAFQERDRCCQRDTSPGSCAQMHPPHVHGLGGAACEEHTGQLRTTPVGWASAGPQGTGSQLSPSAHMGVADGAGGT